MSFIAKNPLSVPEIDYTPSTPKGTRGLFAKEDGWYDINNSGKITKVTCGVGEETNDGGEIFNDYENNKAISNKTTANGTNTIAGCKGFYWCDIDFSEEQPVITLTENRLSPPSSEISTGYAVGDVISIVNDAKYIDCATITAIGDNTITVDALPFTEVVDISSDLNFDDYTLCVLKKPTLGTVDLGIGANASGEGTKALGAYSNVKGKGNTGKGQYSDIGGRDNEGGYCAHIGGRENKGGSYDLIGGYKNNSDGGANVIGGVGNLNDGDNNIMGGRDNTNHGKNNVIGGAENLIKKGHHFIGMFGKGHISSALYQLFGGAWSKATTNTLFAIGNGSSDEERSNAFEVLKDGRAVLGAEPTSDMEAVNKSFLEKIINALNFKNGKGIGSICLPSTKSSKGAYTFTSGYENVNDEQNTIVGGRNNENYGKNNILGGAENTFQKGHHFGAMFGRGHISTALYQLFSGSWSNPSTDTLLAVGNGTSDENRSNALEVHKDGRATLGAAPVNDMDAVNKKYVDGLKKYVDELHNESANTPGIPNPQPDFKQNDETKADYIKNKPFNVGESGALLLNDAKDSEDIAIAVGGELVIAEDVSYKMAGWRWDGVAIAVSPKNQNMFNNLEYVYVTYQGGLLPLKRSNFSGWATGEMIWGADWAGQYADDLIYCYNNEDFDFMAEGLVQTNLDPIVCKVNVFEVKKDGEIVSSDSTPTGDGTKTYTMDEFNNCKVNGVYNIVDNEYSYVGIISSDKDAGYRFYSVWFAYMGQTLQRTTRYDTNEVVEDYHNIFMAYSAEYDANGYRIDEEYQTKTDYGLTTESRTVVGAINEVDSNAKSLTSRLGDVEFVLGGKVDKSTTLSGYGITDAYTKEEVDTIKDDLQLQVNSIYTTTLDDYYTKSETDRQMAEVESVAKGRATGYVFDTLEDLDTWLSNETNTENLVLGDNFYIRAVDVPDYWWDGSAKQQLETQKVDLTEYVKNTDYASDNIAGIVKVKTNTNSHGIKLSNDKILQVACAEKSDIAAKANYTRPIVPVYLEYAVEVCTNQDSDAELTEAQLKLPPSTQFMKDYIEETILGGEW